MMSVVSSQAVKRINPEASTGTVSWMLQKAHKRKGMEQFQYQALWDVLKVEGDRMKEFVTKYCEVKVETSRKKVRKTLYMESESL